MSSVQHRTRSGWAATSLGSVLALKYGKALPAKARDGKEFPVYGSNGVVGYHSRASVEEPAIVLGRKGSIGKAAFSPGPCSPIDTTYYADEFYGQPPRYWLHLLRHLDLSNMNRASAVPGLNREDLYRLDIEVPPLPEQRRIVAEIDALQERSSAAKEALDAIPPLLEKFRRSVLAAAFRGDLTREWRDRNPGVEPASELLDRIREERRRRWIEDASEKGRARAEAKAKKAGKPWGAEQATAAVGSERAKAAKKYKAPEPADISQGSPSLPTSWTVASAADLTECLDRLRKPITRKDRVAGPYPYFGANGQVDSVAGYMFDEELVLVTEDETFYGRTKPIAYRVGGKCWVNNHAHVLRAVPPVPTDYLCQGLMHYNVIPWLSGTTGRAKLTQGAMNALPLALAPAGEMAEIASRVGDLLASADGIAGEVAALRGPQALLRQSILAKAFRGELVPQDPNDEPASVLLGRIQAERAAAELARKKRKPKARR